MKRGTLWLAAFFLVILWLAMALDIVARVVWQESVPLWLTAASVVLFVGWTGLVFGRRWAWALLMASYLCLLTVAAALIHRSVQSPGTDEVMTFDWALTVTALILVLLGLPLTALATDRPAGWVPRPRKPAQAKRARAIVALLVTGLLAVFAVSVLANPPSRRTKEDDVREAVLRHQFDHNASGLQKNAYGYYVSLRYLDDSDNASPAKVFAVRLLVSVFGEDRDPSDRFVQRFKDVRPPVRKVSACTSSVQGVKDSKTGRLGLIFMVGRIRWISDDLVEVKGGYYEGGLSSSGNTYRVARRNSRWILVSDKMDWISWGGGPGPRVRYGKSDTFRGRAESEAG